jgi:predicted branched-subunit amino acid permease
VIDAATARAYARRAGARDAVPFGLAAVLVGASFGVAAHAAGVPTAAAIAMSAVVHAGSAQIAAVAILAQGGSMTAAVAAAALINLRFLAMGLAIGPSLPGGAGWRGVQGQAIVDASWALANEGGGRFDRHRLFGTTAIQWVGWVGGTALGTQAAGAIPEPAAFGIDAIFPAFFLALLMPELRRGGEPAIIAAAGAVVALALAPVAPAGVGIVAAAFVALAGLRESGRV